MSSRRTAPVLAFAFSLVSLGALAFAGCGGSSEEPAACDGIQKADGCHVWCDDAIDCATPGNVCVKTGGADDVGSCAASCKAGTDCPASFKCVDTPAPRGGSKLVCRTRTALGLAEGALGAPCTGDEGCDTDHWLGCDAGTCRRNEGGACGASKDCKSGLACLGGVCKKQAAAGEACAQSTECATGLSCIQATCTTSCEGPGLDACPAGFQCKPRKDASGAYCEKTSLDAGPGKLGASCTAKGQASCDDGYTCIGKVGDTDAYCTKLGGCATDDQCPSGFWCGAIRANDADGNPIPEETKRACQPRTFCAPCATDFDCSGQTGGRCVPDKNGELFCSRECNPKLNSCLTGASCVDVGSGKFACRPDWGACHGDPAAPVGCSACRIDADCGPNGFCEESYANGVRWCSVPCGPKDANGKATCPKAINGEEMVCFDDTMTAYGNEGFPPGTKFSVDVAGHCRPPQLADNLVLYQTIDPPHDACGNGRREGTEECDDGNKTSGDGCFQCQVEDKCRFTVADENDDATPTLKEIDGTPATQIPPKCKSFIVTGTLEKPGDVDAIEATIDSGMESIVSVYTDTLGSCTADLALEAREGKWDVTVPCSKLVAAWTTASAQYEPKTLCNGKLTCGDCGVENVCGTCDDDSGPGDCPRLTVTTLLELGAYKVGQTTAKKHLRVYAKDPTKSGIKYVMVGSYGDGGPFVHPAPLYGPRPTCWW